MRNTAIRKSMFRKLSLSEMGLSRKHSRHVATKMTTVMSVSRFEIVSWMLPNRLFFFFDKAMRSNLELIIRP